MGYNDEFEAELLQAFERCGDRAIAWGECGMDFYRAPEEDEKQEQREVFIRQIKLAVKHGYALIVHSRDAEPEVLDVLLEHLPRDSRLQLHSFAGSVEILARFFEEWPNSYLGMNGVATYPTATKIADLVEFVPLERLLLETDGPFMMPEPYRYSGLGSHPGHIPWIAQCVGAIKGIPPDVVLSRANANFC